MIRLAAGLACDGFARWRASRRRRGIASVSGRSAARWRRGRGRARYGARRRGRARVRAQVPGLGAPQDLGADGRRRPQGQPAHGAPDPRRARGCCSGLAIRPSAASSRRRASGPSMTRRRGAIASGRPTSASSRPGPAAFGAQWRRRLRGEGVSDLPGTHQDLARGGRRAEAASERAAELLGAPLIADLVDRGTGELAPIRVVTDNGPCYRPPRSRATSVPGRSSNTSAPATARPRPTA